MEASEYVLMRKKEMADRLARAKSVADAMQGPRYSALADSVPSIIWCDHDTQGALIGHTRRAFPPLGDELAREIISALSFGLLDPADGFFQWQYAYMLLLSDEASYLSCVEIPGNFGEKAQYMMPLLCKVCDIVSIWRYAVPYEDIPKDMLIHDEIVSRRWCIGMRTPLVLPIVEEFKRSYDLPHESAWRVSISKSTDFAQAVGIDSLVGAYMGGVPVGDLVTVSR